VDAGFYFPQRRINWSLEKGVFMSNHSAHSPGFSIFRWLWKPAIITGAGSTAVVVWFDEIKVFCEEILALIFFFIMGGLMYLFNVYIFKSHMPRHEEIENAKDKGVKK
jgi:hypothetical protein